MVTIEEFCDRHGACRDGRRWALANCKDMQEAWDTAKPEWVVWMATQPRVLDERTLLEFLIWSVRRIQSLLRDPCSVQALDTIEQYAKGEVGIEAVRGAHALANAAVDREWAVVLRAGAFVSDASLRVAMAVARTSMFYQCSVAWYALFDVRWAEARSAADAITLAQGTAEDFYMRRQAVESTTMLATMLAHASYLRKNTRPCFD